jgi:4-amino-4-deoxy-L-arabinose transferase-like glycosyltransferase
MLRPLTKQIHSLNWPLIWIVLGGAFLRLIFLDVIPNGFQQDEAAAGYDAYSMLTTLRTQYGQFLPLFSKTYEGALNDYDETIYRFLIIPFIPLFGLNEFTTRLPAALVGTLDIVFFYYFVKVFFDRRIALVAAFLLAICPWHILISRIAFRTIIFNCLFSLSLFLFFKGLKQPKHLAISGLSFGLTLYSYSSARVFVPLFLLGLVWIYRTALWRIRGYVALGGICFLMILFVLSIYWTSPELMERTNASVCLACAWKHPKSYLLHYLSYISPHFLFLGRHSARSTVQHVGFLNLISSVSIITALYFLFRERDRRFTLIVFWLIIYPFPAFLTIANYDLRATIAIPLLVMLTAYGLVQLEQHLRSTSKLAIQCFRIGAIALTTISFIGFINSYYIGYYSRPPGGFQYGLREAITYANNSAYDCAVVSDQFHRVHTMVLFYTQYPPRTYMNAPIQPYMGTGYTVGKYHVVKIARALDFDQRCLYILKPEEGSQIRRKGYQIQPVLDIKTPHNQVKIRLVKVIKSPAKASQVKQ